MSSKGGRSDHDASTGRTAGRSESGRAREFSGGSHATIAREDSAGATASYASRDRRDDRSASVERTAFSGWRDQSSGSGHALDCVPLYVVPLEDKVVSALPVVGGGHPCGSESRDSAARAKQRVHTAGAREGTGLNESVAVTRGGCGEVKERKSTPVDESQVGLVEGFHDEEVASGSRKSLQPHSSEISPENFRLSATLAGFGNRFPFLVAFEGEWYFKPKPGYVPIWRDQIKAGLRWPLDPFLDRFCM